MCSGSLRADSDGREPQQPWVAVQLQLHGFLAARAGQTELILRLPPSLPEALDEIHRQVPGLATGLGESSYVILVNGTSSDRLGARLIVLSDGDSLDLVPFVAGG